MERPVSRRHHRAVKAYGKQGDELIALAAITPSKRPPITETPKSSACIWGYLIALLTVICAAVIVLAKGLETPLPNGHNGHTDIDVDAPTRLQNLYPEDHIHRASKTIELNWTVTSGIRRPDGVLKRVYLINDLFPGPTVEARSGDRLLITVHNVLENETTSMHWHGLHMRGANNMDGVDSVTQCPIAPGESFLYDFEIAGYQSGTFWYHSHSSLQRGEGLFGAFIVHKPVPLTIRGSTPRRALLSESERYGYDSEALMLMGDWYHDPAQKTMDWYLSAASWGNEPLRIMMSKL
ncbi:hypothetical protein KEM54_003296 [Ascosphaera aggregata]|nr:hypothetical protein KEM54_003296 [Ascosphaera aggregata]